VIFAKKHEFQDGEIVCYKARLVAKGSLKGRASITTSYSYLLWNILQFEFCWCW